MCPPTVVYRIALYAGFHFALSPGRRCPHVRTVDRPKRCLPVNRCMRGSPHRRHPRQPPEAPAEAADLDAITAAGGGEAGEGEAGEGEAGEGTAGEGGHRRRCTYDAIIRGYDPIECTLEVGSFPYGVSQGALGIDALVKELVRHADGAAHAAAARQNGPLCGRSRAAAVRWQWGWFPRKRSVVRITR